VGHWRAEQSMDCCGGCCGGPRDDRCGGRCISPGLPQMVHVPPDRQHFKNCSSAVGGGIGQLIVDFIITSRTQPEVAFRARWALMLGRYPSAESYIKKQLGANFPRWGAPWLQGFTAGSFASSRGEGANKDYKHGVLLRTLTLMTKTWRARSLFILWRRSRKLILGRWTSGASLSTWIVFYDPVRVQCNREGDNVTVFKSHWCTCGMCITAGLPCRHFYAAHRDPAWAGFHVHRHVPYMRRLRIRRTRCGGRAPRLPGAH